MPRLTIRISDELDAAIVARSNRVTAEDVDEAQSGIQKSAALREMLSRYLALIDDGRRRARRLLSGDEAALIADVMNGTTAEGQADVWMRNPLLAMEVQDSLEDGAAEKWGVDGPALLGKLLALDPAARAAILDSVERFWSGNPHDRDPRKILEDV